MNAEPEPDSDWGPCPHMESLRRLHSEWLAEVTDLRSELKESEDERARLVDEITELRRALSYTNFAYPSPKWME